MELKFLVNLIPAKYRKYLYALGGLASLAYTAYLAAEGDWRKAIASLVATALAALAHANTDTNTKPEETDAVSVSNNVTLV